MILDFGRADRRRAGGGKQGRDRAGGRSGHLAEATTAGKPRPGVQPGRRPPVQRSMAARSVSEATASNPAAARIARTASAWS